MESEDGHYFFYQIPGLLMLAFWIWMLVDCIRNDPDRGTWLWILILLNFPGAVVYFFVRWLPHLNLRMPKFMQRWTRRKEIWEAELNVRNIGNAYHLVQLGNLLLETRQYKRAGEAFRKALEMEPANNEALWGAGLVNLKEQHFDIARQHLEKVLKIDPMYKFGDALFAYSQTLVALRDWAGARKSLETYLLRWNHPEAHMMLASVLAEAGDREAVCQRLKTFLEDLRFGSSGNIPRRFYWKWKAQSLLAKLSKGK